MHGTITNHSAHSLMVNRIAFDFNFQYNSLIQRAVVAVDIIVAHTECCLLFSHSLEIALVWVDFFFIFAC